jgi:hypothetical protein
MIVFRDFILFLKRPDFGKQFEIKSFSSFVKIVWKSFLILFAVSIITGLVISTPLRYFSLLPSQRDTPFSLINIIKISLLLPIIEELIFRLPLRISKINIAISLSIILFVILNKIDIYVAIIFSIVLFVFLFLLIKEESNILERTDNFFTKYFYIFFYFQAFIFGFFHLTNYVLDFKYFYLFPLFVINQIFIGVFLGYIRVRYTYGIFVCIVTHMVVNSIYCLIISP